MPAKKKSIPKLKQPAKKRGRPPKVKPIGSADKLRQISKGKPHRFEKGNTCAFKPGQSGNPAGRPKGKTISEIIRAKLGDAVSFDKEGRSYQEVIATNLLDEAARGNMVAIREVLDRLEGRPRQSLSVTGEDGGPVQVVTDRKSIASKMYLKITGSGKSPEFAREFLSNSGFSDSEIAGVEK